MYSSYSLETGTFINVPNDEEMIDLVKNYVNESVSTIERLREENKRIKEETYKDKEIASLVAERDRYREEWRRGFPISKEEKEKIDSWMKDHEEKCKGGHGCCGGKYSYEFTPTGLGVVGEIVCNRCGEEFSFSEL